MSKIITFISSTIICGAYTMPQQLDPESIPSDVYEVLKLFFSMLGGVLTTIILSILKKKFPEWFRKEKSKK